MNLDYEKCPIATIDAVFPFVKGKGTRPPTLPYKSSGHKITEWRYFSLSTQKKRIREWAVQVEEERKQKARDDHIELLRVVSAEAEARQVELKSEMQQEEIAALKARRETIDQQIAKLEADRAEVATAVSIEPSEITTIEASGAGVATAASVDPPEIATEALRCGGFTLETLRTSRSKNKDDLERGYFHLVGEAFMEKRNIFLGKERWTYGDDAIGVIIPSTCSTLPTNSEKSPDDPVNDLTPRNWILKKGYTTSGNSSVEDCAFHFSGCCGEDISTGVAICNVCSAKRKGFFARCFRAEALRSKPLHANTSVKQLKLCPSLLEKRALSKGKVIKKIQPQAKTKVTIMKKNAVIIPLVPLRIALPAPGWQQKI